MNVSAANKVALLPLFLGRPADGGYNVVGTSATWSRQVKDSRVQSTPRNRPDWCKRKPAPVCQSYACRLC